MLYVGIDDTDGKGGMCTTYLVNRVLEKVGYPPGELPRLIRLNPNIPWKTRGNGAVAIVLDAPEQAAPEVMKTVAGIVRENAVMEEDGTNPGIVVSPVPLSIELYHNAVKGLADLEKTRRNIQDWSAEAKGFKNCRGLIGAAAAVAWHPDLVDDATYEVIAYRKKDRWGAPRTIEPDSVRRMAEECPGTFNNIDEKNRHMAIAPNTPCPILFGIRGEDPEELIQAKEMIQGEDMASWTLFMSNQGTDDHLQERRVAEIEPFESPIVHGTVSSSPRTITGGHVFFDLEDETGNISCAAYEPTKEFRDIIKKLSKGDEVVAMGSLREEPRNINLEKIIILGTGKRSNPVCSICGKSMSSMGRGQGYRCKKCGMEQKEQVVEETLPAAAYQTPVCARRHLMRPLERGLIPILKSYI